MDGEPIWPLNKHKNPNSLWWWTRCSYEVQNYEAHDYGHDLDSLIACFIAYKNCMQRKKYLNNTSISDNKEIYECGFRF